MRRIVIGAVFLLCAAGYAGAQELRTENVIIVTLDGYRWREVFSGADRNILFRRKYVRDTSVAGKFWHESPKERRRKLMPFFWNVIDREGQLYGNRKLRNGMRVTNGNLYSYSGYSEMFVGFADKRIRNNKPVVNPNYNVLEVANKHSRYRDKVAVFSTWQTMPYILRSDVAGIHMNAGDDIAKGHKLTRKEKALNLATQDIKNPHGDRYDTFTFQYAMEYLKREQPRVMFISLDETDEHGHGGRYDQYLTSAHRADSLIAELWTLIQSHDQYRDKTTLIIGTDHGRGKSARGWMRHAILFRGSAQVWLAVLGPDTPASGEMKGSMRLKQHQVAETIAAFLDIPYEHGQRTGDVITSAFVPELVGEPDVVSAGSGQ
jgi:hypothetical protein